MAEPNFAIGIMRQGTAGLRVREGLLATRPLSRQRLAEVAQNRYQTGPGWGQAVGNMEPRFSKRSRGAVHPQDGGLPEVYAVGEGPGKIYRDASR